MTQVVEKEAAAPSTGSKEPSVDETAGKKTPTPFRKGPRFWAILIVLAIISLSAALEATVTSTVLPSIIIDLDGGEDFVWVANAYFLTMAAFQPAFGQIANVFGRRWPLIIAAAIFTLGSGICGGATSMAMMIAGRAVQGLGAAGISVLSEIVVCDLVPLAERGTYIAAVFGMVGLGASLGPLFGGLLVRYSTWRWAFYLGLPIGGVGLVMLFFFLQVKYDKSQTMATKLSSLDWLGNTVFVGGTVPVLIALAWAGGQYAWSSYQVLVPLIIGLVTMGVFVWLESNTRLIPNPMMPLRLFSNSISAIVFLLTFLHGVVTLWALYFLPVYFQGVLAADAYNSGIMILPTIFAIIPGIIVGGLLLTKFGKYKPLFVAAFALIVVGFGLFVLLDENSPTGYWVGFQIIESFGAGIGMGPLLPTLLAPLSDADTALATGTWTFMRSFGVMWGVAIAGTIYTSRASELASQGAISSSPIVAAEFEAGKAYGLASAHFLDMLPSQTRAEVVAVQNAALQRSWQIAIAFGAIGFIATLFFKQIPLRKELETDDYGMVDKKDKPVEEEATEAKENMAPVSASK